MVSQWKRFKHPWLILPLVSLVLSVMGIWHALPMHVVGDEEALVGGALKMIELKTLVPSLHPVDFASLYYPPLISYLILIAIVPIVLVKFVLLGFSVSGVQDYFALNQDALWVSARLLSALFSAGTVAIIFHIAKRVFSEKVAWLSSIFLLTSFFHVVSSHWVRHWTFTTFFVYATIFCFIVFLETKQQRFAFLAALLGGLGFGVSYIGSLGFIAGVVYWWFKRNEIGAPSRSVMTMGGIFGVLAVIFSFLNIQEIIRLAGTTDGTVTHPKTIHDAFESVSQAFAVLFLREPILFLCSVGSLFLERKKRLFPFVVFGSLIVYTLILYVFLHLEQRYFSLFVPSLCVSAGLLLSSYVVTITARPLRAIVVAAVFIVPFMTVARYDVLLMKGDTREQALQWIREHIAYNEPFLLSSETMFLPRTFEALRRDAERGRIRAFERYALAHNTFPVSGRESRFHYYNLHFWKSGLTTEHIQDFLRSEKPRYFLVDYWKRDDLTPIERVLMDRGTLVARFQQSKRSDSVDINGNFDAHSGVVFHIQRPGPFVDIYAFHD